MTLDNTTMLVVEDDLLMRQLLIDTLELNGVSPKNIRAFADGDHAYAFLQESGCRDAIVICDIAMPRLNGFQLYEKVYEQMPGLHFIFITAVKLEPSEKCLLKQTGLGLLEKPFATTELMQAIHDILQDEDTPQPRPT